MRLFRQTRLGEWADVFDRMASELKRMLGTTSRAGPITVHTSAGELIDKITILEIKCERISDPTKLRNIRSELAMLVAARNEAVDVSDELDRLTAELKSVNQSLWDIEDGIRDCERAKDFGRRFTDLARSVYQNNDRRATIKRRINELLDSKLVEEKSYTAY